jgi:uncharacterized protein YxjI
MRYHMRERAWSLTEAFIVRDDRGQPVFEIRGKFFHIGDNLLMYEQHSDQPVVQIKQQVLSLLPCYDIYRNGQHWARVNEQLSLFGERFHVKGDNGMTFHIQGNIWDWNFSISDDHGNLLGQVSRQLSLFRDSYAIDVAPGVDAPFIIALAIVLEMVKEHHDKKKEER